MNVFVRAKNVCNYGISVVTLHLQLFLALTMHYVGKSLWNTPWKARAYVVGSAVCILISRSRGQSVRSNYCYCLWFNLFAFVWWHVYFLFSYLYRSFCPILWVEKKNCSLDYVCNLAMLYRYTKNHFCYKLIIWHIVVKNRHNSVTF